MDTKYLNIEPEKAGFILKPSKKGGQIDMAELWYIENENGTNYDNFIFADPIIFTDEARATFLELPDTERTKYLMGLIDKFYASNAEYANFMRVQIYKEPLLLLDYFRKIKKSHFKKCNVTDKGRFTELQKRIEAAEIAIARNPINYDDIKLAQIWPVLRIRDIFTESELAAFYYLQNPRNENTSTELITGISDYYTFGFSAWLFPTNEAIQHAAADRGFYDLTATGKKKNDRHKAVSLNQLDNGFEYEQSKKGSIATVRIINKDLVKSTATIKMFIFILAKATQQNFNPTCIFSLKELVNLNWYSSISNARAGVEQLLPGVQSLQIGAKLKKGKKYINQDNAVLFPYYRITNNIVEVDLNEKFDFAALCYQYAIVPAWAFSLNNNAFYLIYYIFTRLRAERSNKLKLKLSLIRDQMALPTREEYKRKNKSFKPERYVKEPIIKVIEEIEAAIEQKQIKNITIKKHFLIDAKNLEEWLLNGYIEVEIIGEYADKLKEIQENQTKIIEANTRRKEAARALVEAQKEATEKND